jgi:hypothetical protein
MFTLKEQTNGKWTFGIQKGRKFIPVTDTTYYDKGTARRGLRRMINKEAEKLSKPMKRGKKSKG